MSPLIWIQPANLGGLFFASNLLCPRKQKSRLLHAESAGFVARRPVQNLYETARKEMIGSAFNSAFETPSSVPSAALMMTDDVVFSGM